jgi:hypothetical protein
MRLRNGNKNNSDVGATPLPSPPMSRKSSRHTNPRPVCPSHSLFFHALTLLTSRTVPIATPVPTLAPALARLTQQLTQLTASHTSNTAALNSLAQERDDVDKREMEMREMVGKAEEKRGWFEQFRDWVEGVAGFLDEKVRFIPEMIFV